MTPGRGRVVGLGLVMADLRVRCPEPPAPEADTRVQDFDLAVGGSTANVLLALAAAGWDTALVSAVGDDHLGRFLLAGLADAGVATEHVRAVPDGTASCLVLDTPPTRTLLWHLPDGLADALADDDLSWLAGASALHVNGRFPETALRACRAARDRGVLVSLNAGRGDVADGVAALLPVADLLVTTDEWAAEYTSARTGRADPAAACRALLDAGPAVVSVTCGADGSWSAARGGDPVHTPATPEPLRTTAGAGDAYHAGFLAAHLSGLPLAECAWRGAAMVAARCGIEGVSSWSTSSV